MKCVNKRNSASVVFVVSQFLLLNVIVSAVDIDCSKSDSPLSCHGVRLVRNVMNYPMGDDNQGLNSMKIIPGFEVIESNVIDGNGRSVSDDNNDSSILGRVSNYVQNHEIKIKFSELLGKSDFKDVIKASLTSVDEGKGVFGEFSVSKKIPTSECDANDAYTEK